MKRMNAAVLRTIVLCASVAAAGQSVADVTELPQDIQDKLYNPALLDPNQPIADSAYRDFVAKNPPPWKIGYASSYAGNTWRAGVMDRLQNEIIPKWQKLGLISEVIVTQSNLNDSTQIQQMRQLVDQGVDAIIVCCSNPTALNQTVEYAYSKGVPVFSGIGYLTSPYAVNSSANFVVGGRMMGDWMANEIGNQPQLLPFRDDLVLQPVHHPGAPGVAGIAAGIADLPRRRILCHEVTVGTVGNRLVRVQQRRVIKFVLNILRKFRYISNGLTRCGDRCAKHYRSQQSCVHAFHVSSLGAESLRCAPDSPPPGCLHNLRDGGNREIGFSYIRYIAKVYLFANWGGA